MSQIMHTVSFMLLIFCISFVVIADESQTFRDRKGMKEFSMMKSGDTTTYRDSGD